MKNLILKTLAVSMVGSLLCLQTALADRQGGGGLIVLRTFDSSKFMDIKSLQITDLSARFDVNASNGEYVRFKAAQGDKITFDYSWFVGADKGLAEVTLDKAKASEQTADLIRALLESKATANWKEIK
jgi:hypothetical protein